MSAVLKDTKPARNRQILGSLFALDLSTAAVCMVCMIIECKYTKELIINENATLFER